MTFPGKQVRLTFRGKGGGPADAWVHFTSAPDPLFERAAIRDLQGAGVELDAATSKAPPAAKRGHIPGVLFFDSVDADLAREVRNLTRGGISRMLAIATPAAILAPDDAWWLMSEGASDVFSWDHSTGPADEVAARLQRWADVEAMLRSEVVQANLVGESPAWLRVLRQIIEVAHYTDASILITGESGTGKELTARLVHTLDTRHGKGRLVVADCTTIVPNLSGSEFFGHERGAFTGAVSARDGAFALADGERCSLMRSVNSPRSCRQSCFASSRRAHISGSAATHGGRRNSG